MERVVNNLNHALLEVMKTDSSVYLVGEDLLDPYGGAFKVSRGLSSAFPDRVLSTPISEGGLLGVANGLVLAGNKAIAELMFGDFTFLAMDQIVNFAAKSATMYGERLPFPLLIRCPVGGRRGYGATHSQTIGKHLIGVPNLSLYELSPLHENLPRLRGIFASERPSILFENKILYTQKQYVDDVIDDLYTRRFLDDDEQTAILETGEQPDVILVTGGGTLSICLEAARRLLLEVDCAVDIVVPHRIYPFPVEVLDGLLGGRTRVAVVEEGTSGGAWGSEVADVVYRRYWDRLPGRIVGIQSADSIIPSARHLEDQILVSSAQIVREICEEL